jgi:nucleotide-binding universal stress UspA family protein
MYKNILIPTDGSPVSRKAIAAGVKLAQSLGARVTGFFAAPAATPVVYKSFVPVGYMSPEDHEKLIEKTAEKCLGEVQAAARAAGVPCDVLVVTNDFPADAIISAAKRKRCDLIFMASHGRKGRKDNLLGSETQKVLAQSGIPVLVHR